MQDFYLSKNSLLLKNIGTKNKNQITKGYLLIQVRKNENSRKTKFMEQKKTAHRRNINYQ